MPLVGIASNDIQWCCDDEKSMRHHKKHVSWHVESILTYHFGLNLHIISSYINSPSFSPSSSVSYLSRNRAVSHSFISLIFHIAYVPMYSLLYCAIGIMKYQFLICPETELLLYHTIVFYSLPSHLYWNITPLVIIVVSWLDENNKYNS